jgi:tetratricopeptide (TPR) repeat protein
MRRFILLSTVFSIIAVSSFAQNEHKAIRKGNKALKNNDYIESEVQYRKALESNVHSLKVNSTFPMHSTSRKNMMNHLKLPKKSISGFIECSKAMIFHNKGNTLYKQQKYKKALMHTRTR